MAGAKECALKRRIAALPLLRLLGRLRPIAWQAAGAYGAALATTVVALALPGLLGAVVDAALSPSAQALAWLPVASGAPRLLAGASLIVALGAVGALLSFAQRYGTAWVGRTVATDFRRNVFDQLLRLDVAFHDRTSVGQLMTRVTDDTEKVRQFAAVAVSELLSIAGLLVGSVVVLTRIDPVLALVALAPIPLLAGMAVSGARQLTPRFAEVQHATGVLTGRLQESLAQIRVVQAFRAEGRTGDGYESDNERLYGTRLGVARIFTTMFPAMSGILGVAAAAVLLVGGRRVVSGELTIGTLVLFNSYIFLLGQPVRRLGFFLNLSSRASTSARRVYELLDRQPTVADAADAVDLSNPRGAITWERVSVTYDSATPVLRDVTLAVRPGEHVAVVGRSGAGKSTLVQLLVRLYDPNEGAVRLDGHDLRDLTRDSVRAAVGLVEQEPFLFSASVHDNVGFGAPGREVTRAEVEAVCRIAGAHDFVAALPDGYDTVVGERGVTLSGGQRQRLALARTLLARPRVLVLDDALSAVDASTEAHIRDALRAETSGQTVVQVAQRLSTVLAADRIVVLDAGRVVQQGTHDELVAAEGPYADLFAPTAGAAARQPSAAAAEGGPS